MAGSGTRRRRRQTSFRSSGVEATGEEEKPRGQPAVKSLSAVDASPGVSKDGAERAEQASETV